MKQAKTKSGPGYSRSTKERGDSLRVDYLKIEDPEHVVFDRWALSMSIWSLKDRIRKEAENAGKPRTWWKNKVRTSKALRTTADLANRTKHGGSSEKPWTDHNPTFNEIAKTIPQGDPPCRSPLRGSRRVSGDAIS